MSCWIQEELATANLGDKRLDKRYGRILERLFDSPQSSMSGAMKGWAEVAAASRFFDNAKVTVEAVLKPHQDAALARVQRQERVLVIQDTTEADYTSKTKLEGKGPLNSERRQGFYVHTQWLVGDQRLPLGAWSTDIYAREGLQEITSNHKQREFEDKESHRWFEGYEKACELAAMAPGVQVISVSDREGDVYEVFVERARRVQAGEPAAHWVIRCCQKHRALLGEEGQKAHPKLAEEVQKSRVLGTIDFEISAKMQVKRVKGKNVSAPRQARHVTQEIRVGKLELRPPWRKEKQLPVVTIWAVSAKEINPPAGQDPIDWLILTSIPVNNFAEAKEILEIYLSRWEVEVFHKVLKTGCTIEDLQLKEAERIKPALALYMIVAWRVLYLMKLGRDCPRLPCDAVFEEAEWKSIVVISSGRKALEKKPCLGELIILIAKQGGYLGRKGDGPPGPKVMWLGLMCLQNFALAWKAFGETDTS